MPVSLGTISPGEWLGEIGVIDRGPATATVRARDTTTVLALSHAALLQLQEEAPEAGSAIVRDIARELAVRLRRSTTVVVHAINGGPREAIETKEENWVARAASWLLGGGDSSS